MVSKRKRPYAVVAPGKLPGLLVCKVWRHRPRVTWDTGKQTWLHQCKRCGQQTTGWNRASRYE
jgi:hypothetical protein